MLARVDEAGTLAIMVFFRRPPKRPERPDERLVSAVRAELPNADEETRRLVTAVAGLLACVAYADREYSDAEATKIRTELARVHGLAPESVEALSRVLRDEMKGLAMAGAQLWCRELVELGDRNLRWEVLEVLVELAASDSEISLAETNYLRRLATSLGFAQPDYDALQERHRDKLAVLRRGPAEG